MCLHKCILCSIPPNENPNNILKIDGCSAFCQCGPLEVILDLPRQDGHDPYQSILDNLCCSNSSLLGSCLGLKYLCHSINTIPQRNALFYSTSMPFHTFAQHEKGGASALTLVWYQQIDFKTYRKLCAQHQALQLK